MIKLEVYIRKKSDRGKWVGQKKAKNWASFVEDILKNGCLKQILTT